MSTLFGPYKLLKRVGVGGMAEVYRARLYGAEGFVKAVCIKRILPALNEDPEFVRMFINEARVAAMLQHANIVQIYAFDQIDGNYYIAMEWVDGPDLRKLLNIAAAQQRRVPQAVVIHTAVEALKGLHYAHNQTENGKKLNLIHRDITPHNLLISSSGEIKITDFGIAKAAAIASFTRSGSVKGKLAYMSPEQAIGSDIDQRTDVYGLGIILWELLTGKRRYAEAAGPAELLVSVQRGEMQSVSAFNPEVGAELAELVDRMLAPNRDDRFPTAAAALREFSCFSSVRDGLEAADFVRDLIPHIGEVDAQNVTPSEDSDLNVDRPTRDSAEQEEALAPTTAFSREEVAAGIATSRPDEQPRRRATDHVKADSTGPRRRRRTLTGADRDSSQPQARHVTSTGPLRSLKAAHDRLFQKTGTTARLVVRQVVRNRASVIYLAALAMAASAFVFWWVGNGQTTTSDVNSKAPPETTPAVVKSIAPDPRPIAKAATPKLTEQPAIVNPVEPKPSGAAKPVQQQQPVINKPTESKPPTIAEPEPSTIANVASPEQAVAMPKDAETFSDEGEQTTDETVGPVMPRDIAADDAARDQIVADVSTTNSAQVATPTSETRKPKRKARRAQTRKYGYVDIVVFPWARVRIDGRRVGQQTPIKGYRLTEGNHHVVIFNSALKKKEQVQVKIEADKTATIRRDWLTSAGDVP